MNARYEEQAGTNKIKQINLSYVSAVFSMSSQHKNMTYVTWQINPYNAEIFLYEPWRLNFFSIIINAFS